MGIIHSQNWDSVSAPALPSGWLSSGSVHVTTTAVKRSGANSLLIPSVNREIVWQTQDGQSGDVEIEAWVRYAGTPLANSVDLQARRSGASPGTAAIAYTGYGFQTFYGPAGVVTGTTRIVRYTGSGQTTLAGIGTQGALLPIGEWVRVIGRAETVGSQVNLTIKIQRASDGYWFAYVDATAGVWQAAEAVALSFVDDSANRVTGQGFMGIRTSRNAAGTEAIHVDDLVLRDLVTAPTGSVGIFGLGGSVIRRESDAGGMVPLIRGCV